MHAWPLHTDPTSCTELRDSAYFLTPPQSAFLVPMQQQQQRPVTCCLCLLGAPGWEQLCDCMDWRAMMLPVLEDGFLMC